MAVVREAVRRFRLDRLVVLVVAEPGHKGVELDAATRLELARAAFPGFEVKLDLHARTIDTLREGRWEDPLFLIGADEFCDFLSWKEPQAILELARLGVATRPGFPTERLERVLRQLERPERIVLFEIEPVATSSSEVRGRLERGESIRGLVPDAVADLVEGLGLYRRYTGRGSAQGDRTA